MNCIVFDTSTIISIVTNNLLHILKPLKSKYKGEFCMPAAVREELVDKPIHSKKFKFEAIQILAEINNGVLALHEERKEEVDRLLRLANSIYMAHGNYITVLHSGEVGVLVLAKDIGAKAIAIDERTTRIMIESPETIAKILGGKMHTPIKIDRENLEQFKDYTKGMTVIRSSELALIAYEMGILDEYLPKKRGVKLQSINSPRQLLDGVLWGLKLRGCSINSEEIDEILSKEKF